jgi:predicted transcriptional regulator
MKAKTKKQLLSVSLDETLIAQLDKQAAKLDRTRHWLMVTILKREFIK